MSLRRTLVVLAAVALVLPGLAAADSVTTHPYQGITRIDRTETSPRAENIHVIEIDLAASGIGFKVTPPGGTRDTVRQTTLDCLNQQNAQLAINGHFFVPFPTADTDVNAVGLGASMGNVFSPFEPQPVASGFADQSHAIIQYAPALNIDSTNHASIVHRDTSYPDNKHVLEAVTLWNALSGSAQIVTNGVKTIPTYSGTAMGGLNPINGYSDSNSWYSALNARTVIGLTQNSQTLVLLTVDKAGGSLGMTPGEVADMLINEYGVYNALNLDGGGSTTLAMQDPVTHVGSIVNVSSDNSLGRAVGTNLAVFAVTPEPATMALLACGVAALLAARRRNLLRRSAAKSALFVAIAACLALPGVLMAGSTTTQPFLGITRIDRTETSPRAENMHIIKVDLTAPGIGFAVTPPGGTRDTVCQTTLDFLVQEQAQAAINTHFWVPFPTPDGNANLVGIAAHEGNVFSPFEPQPVGAGFPDQSFAIIQYAPGLNIDAANHASIVHRDTSYSDNKHVLEPVTLCNAFSSCAQIVTNGLTTIPTYSGTAMGGLNPGGGYSDSYSWYKNLVKSQTVVGLSQDNRTLVMFTVDQAGGSTGMTVEEVANLLLNEYGVYNALCLDNGGSTSMAMQDSATGTRGWVNHPSDNYPTGRLVGSSLAVFAQTPEPATVALLAGGAAAILAARRRKVLGCGSSTRRATTWRWKVGICGQDADSALSASKMQKRPEEDPSPGRRLLISRPTLPGSLRTVQSLLF